MKKLVLYLNPVLAAIVLGACSTSPKMPDNAWKVAPVQTVRHGSPSAAGYYALGRYKEGQGDSEEAVAAYRKAVAAEPGRVAAWSALGVLQALRGHVDDGLAALERAVSLAPAASHLHNNLGYALLLAGRDEAAVGALRRAVELDDGNRRAWANLATAYHRLNVPERAELADARARGKPAPPPKTPAPGGGAVLVAGSAVVSPLDLDVAAPVPLAALPAAASPATGSPATGSISATPPPVASTPSAAEQRLSSGRITVRSAQSGDAPDSIVVKITENVYALRNGAAEAASSVAEAAAIVAVAVPAAAAMPAESRPAPARLVTPAARVAARYEISNGHGGNGLAHRLATLLAKQGEAWPRLTNQRPFDVPASFVEYRDGYREAAESFAAALPFKPVIAAAASAQLAVDVRLVLGRELTTSEACAVLGLCAVVASEPKPAALAAAPDHTRQAE